MGFLSKIFNTGAPKWERIFKDAIARGKQTVVVSDQCFQSVTTMYVERMTEIGEKYGFTPQSSQTVPISYWGNPAIQITMIFTKGSRKSRSHSLTL